MSGDWTLISNSLSLRLRLFDLTSPPIITRRPIMQKVRSRTFPEGHSASTACRHTVSGSFHSWYWFTIGRQVVFSLGRWSSQIPTGLLEPRGTQEPDKGSGLFV